MIRLLSYRNVMSGIVNKKVYRSFSSYNNVQLFSISEEAHEKKARAALVITINSIISVHI